MKTVIKIAILLIPTIYMSLIFYQAVVDNNPGQALYDIAIEQNDAAGKEEKNYMQSHADERTTIDAKSISESVSGIQNSTMRTLYKWRDKNNIIIISSESPPENTHVETFYFQTENDQLLKTPGPIISAGGTAQTSPESSFVNNPLKVYTPTGLRQLISYSKEIGDKIELRGEELNNLVDQLQNH